MSDSLVIPVRSVVDTGISLPGETSWPHSHIGMPFLTRMAPMSMTHVPDGVFTVSVSMTTESAVIAYALNSANEPGRTSSARRIGICDGRPVSPALPFFDTA